MKWLNDIKNYDYIIIYGAHLVALELYRHICIYGFRNKLLGFAVTDSFDNPKIIDDLTVKRIEEFIDYAGKSTVIIIAMPAKFHMVVEQHSRKYGFKDYIKISQEVMADIKGDRLLNEKNFPVKLKKSNCDKAWLDAYTENKFENVRCKYPTLFYMDDYLMRENTFDVFGEYKSLIGNIFEIKEFNNQMSEIMDYDNIQKVFRIYMAFDRSVIEFVKKNCFSPWIFPLQLGAIDSAYRYGVYFDDENGGGISKQNSSLAEMTGAWWIWKYAPDSKYKGLCHYRRHFKLDEEIISIIIKNNIDVLLTTPRYVPGGVRNMFIAETPVKAIVFDNIFFSMEKHADKDITDFIKFLNGTFYFPNNMVVAKSEIYDEYCAWIFPILEEMIEKDLLINYGHESDRHIAYAAELLTSFYFIKRSNEFVTRYIDYIFYDT